MHAAKLLSAVVVCLAAGFLVSGCSGGTKKVTVNGKVTRGAEALKG